MSTKIPSVEARVIYQMAITKEARTARAHHRVTTPAVRSVKTAAQKLEEGIRAVFVKIRKGKQQVHGAELREKALKEEYEEGMWMSSSLNGEKRIGRKASSTLGFQETAEHVSNESEQPNHQDVSNGPGKPKHPDASKQRPRTTLLAADCSLLAECDEETPEEKEVIASKVQAAMAIDQQWLRQELEAFNQRHDPARRIHTKDIIHAGPRAPRPTVVRQASIRSQAARHCDWVSDVAECIDSDFSLPELSRFGAPSQHMPINEAWWKTSTSSHALSTSIVVGSQKGSDTPFARHDSVSTFLDCIFTEHIR